MVLIESGFTFRKALLFNFISACTAIAGFFIGASIAQNESARVWIFVVTAGTFTYIALVDLVSHLYSTRAPEGRRRSIVVLVADIDASDGEVRLDSIRLRHGWLFVRCAHHVHLDYLRRSHCTGSGTRMRRANNKIDAHSFVSTDRVFRARGRANGHSASSHLLVRRATVLCGRYSHRRNMFA